MSVDKKGSTMRAIVSTAEVGAIFYVTWRWNKTIALVGAIPLAWFWLGSIFMSDSGYFHDFILKGKA